METNRSSLFNQDEDELLCCVYVEILQDLIGSNNQSLEKFWERIGTSYDEKKPDGWEIRSIRSLQNRMNNITYYVMNLKSCITQVENTLPSDASQLEIMEKAKKLFIQDPKLRKGFKFDHIWNLMKNI
ncbi:unnamed protein product [Arabidopsis halleri]